MKDIKTFILESINESKLPNFSKYKFNLDKDTVNSNITEYFVDHDEWDNKQANQLKKLFNQLQDNIKFAEVDEDDAWDINDIIQKQRIKKLARVAGDGGEPTAELYKIDNSYVIQLVGDDDLTTYVGN